jgi:hypothetical protein
LPSKKPVNPVILSKREIFDNLGAKKIMAYQDFTLELLKEKFGLGNQQRNLFDHIVPIKGSNWLAETLAMGKKNPIKSEKAKSEMIITPILLEMKNRNDDYFTIYSGDTLEGDKSLGLKGKCDFIISKNTHSFTISYPIFALIEAKRNDFDLGIDQCAAQMYGAWLYNQRSGQDVPFVYGCVTTADEWLFLRLENNVFWIDTEKYFINQLETILGILQHIIDQYKEVV